MGGREEDPATLAAPTQAFPWLVKVVVISPRLELLCGGVVLSPAIVLVPAHCITGIPTQTVRVLVARQRKVDGSDSISDVAYHVSGCYVEMFTELMWLQVENIIVHPQYNSTTTSHLADLAVLKLEPRSDVGTVQWGNYTAPACLPLALLPPASSCQVAGWAVTTQGKGSLRSAVLGHGISLQSEAACLQDSLIDRAVEPRHVLCSSTRCNRFVTGPVFCRSSSSGGVTNVTRRAADSLLITERYHVTSLPTGGSDWCNSGATTNLAHYAGWLQRTIQYLDPSFVTTVTDHADAVEETRRLVTEDKDEDNNCSSSPCGDKALCWNGEGSSFLCTCQSEFPHGNPYTGSCAKCQYDSHCGPGQKCEEQQCVAGGAEGGESHPVPPDYMKVDGQFYYISDKPLSWSLAQYGCMNKEGEFCSKSAKIRIMMVYYWHHQLLRHQINDGTIR